MDAKEPQIYEDDLNLMQLCREMMNHWVIIICVALIAAIAGFLFTKSHRNYEYTASFDMIVTVSHPTNGRDVTAKDPQINHPNIANSGTVNKNNSNKNNKTAQKDINLDATPTAEDIELAKSLVDTYATVMESNIILDPIIENMDLDMSYSDLCDMLSISVKEGTQTFTVSVTGSNEEQVLDIAQQLSKVPTQFISKQVKAGSCRVLTRIEMEKNDVSPSAKKMAILAAFLGAFVVIGVLFVRFLLANYIEDDEDVQHYLGLPVVGVIPAIKEVK